VTDFVSAPFYDLFHESWYVPKIRRGLSSLLAGVRRSILEVGAGTGLVTASLADWTPAEIFALEPSAAMRAVLLSRLSSRPDLLGGLLVFTGHDERDTASHRLSILRPAGELDHVRADGPERPDDHEGNGQTSTKYAARCPRTRADLRRRGQAGRLNGTVTVMVSGNQRAPPWCCGAPQAVCRYRMGGPKPSSVSPTGNP